MNQKVLTAFLVFILGMFISISLFAAIKNEINQIHTENGLSCEDCHDNENPETAPQSTRPCIDCHTDMVDADAVILVDNKGHKTKFWLHDRSEIHADEKSVPDESQWCITCHKQHEPTVLWCNNCHTFTTKVP